MPSLAAAAAEAFAASHQPLRCSRGLEAPDEATIRSLLDQVHADRDVREVPRPEKPQPGGVGYYGRTLPLIRSVAADALRDAGRTDEADLLADADQPVRVSHRGKVKPAFDHFAWPGGYPIYYLAGGNFVLCADCANHASNQPDANPIRSDVHEEGPPLVCEDCGHQIESAYGDPAAEDAE